MSKQKPKSPLQELADKANAALELCWERLRTDELTPADVTKMVESWRVMRRAHLEAEEAKQTRKEERESDKET